MNFRIISKDFFDSSHDIVNFDGKKADKSYKQCVDAYYDIIKEYVTSTPTIIFLKNNTKILKNKNNSEYVVHGGDIGAIEKYLNEITAQNLHFMELKEPNLFVSLAACCCCVGLFPPLRHTSLNERRGNERQRSKEVRASTLRLVIFVLSLDTRETNICPFDGCRFVLLRGRWRLRNFSLSCT